AVKFAFYSLRTSIGCSFGPQIKSRDRDSLLQTFRQALGVCVLFQFLRRGADAQAELAKPFTLDVLLFGAREHIAIVEPYLHYLLAVFRNKFVLGPFSFLGSPEISK